MGNTHLYIGLAASLAVMQPQTPEEFLTAVIGGSVGSVVADSDQISPYSFGKSMKKVIKNNKLSLSTAAALLITDYFSHFGIVETILTHKERSAVGCALLLTFVALCMCSRHRTFSHSMLGCLLGTTCVGLIYAPFALSFGIAYLLHILLDLTNKGKLTLFYPLKKGFCLGWCYADKAANTLLMWGGLVLALALLSYSALVAFQILPSGGVSAFHALLNQLQARFPALVQAL